MSNRDTFPLSPEKLRKKEARRADVRIEKTGERAMTDEANGTTVQDPPLYNVSAFCEAHDISRGYLYQLWNEGRGPRRTKLGRRTVIRGEAAAEWRRQMERETPQLAGKQGECNSGGEV